MVPVMYIAMDHTSGTITSTNLQFEWQGIGHGARPRGLNGREANAYRPDAALTRE